MANLIAATAGIDQDTLKKLRVKCIMDVKKTNGEVDLEAAYRYQKELD